MNTPGLSRRDGRFFALGNYPFCQGDNGHVTFQKGGIMPESGQPGRRSARSIIRPAVRPLAVTGLRAVFSVADPVTVGWWGARLAPQPERVAAELSRRLGALVPPTPADVIGNYLRGLLLAGRAAGPGERNGFEWSAFPRRAIITAETAKVPKRLRPIRRRSDLEVRFNRDFESIIRECRACHGGGWITPELIDLYCTMDRWGCTGTVATYRDGQPVGGLWGVGIGPVFSIMSMFHWENHAGSLALAALAESLRQGGPWSVVDCVQLNPNFARYGFTEIPAGKFAELVLDGLAASAAPAANRRAVALPR
jgi:leucyl/phenylalanyl-tRNA---protein transferase